MRHPRRHREGGDLGICTASHCCLPTISCGTRNTFQLFIHLTICLRFKGTPVPTSCLLGTCHSPFLVRRLRCIGFHLQEAANTHRGERRAWRCESGHGFNAHYSSFRLSFFPEFMFSGGEYSYWNTFAVAFTVILLWPLTFVAYIVSFKFIKKPSRFQMRLARYFMVPVFFLTAMSVYAVLSGGRWATLFVAPMCVLLVLSTMLLAVELSAQAYRGDEVPVWRYRASYMMGGVLLLMYPMHFVFDYLPLLFK